MIAVLLLALRCSTEPTKLPVSKWQHFTSAEGHFEITYPPCWTAQTGPSRVYLKSPDAEYEIGFHAADVATVRSAAARIFGERHKKQCNVAGGTYDCAEWDDPDGHQTFIAIVHGHRGYNVGITSHGAKWNDEARQILKTIRLDR